MRSLLPRATHILTESDLGKENVINRYSVDKKRVTVMPMVPSDSSNLSKEWLEANYLCIKEKYLLNHDYIFYPAQFWAHKNHIYILEGLKILKEDFNVKLCAVFSGSDHGNLTFIKNSAKKLGVDDLVHFIGFVDDNEIPFLYQQATALVMPTYFGPTNIPPLEASLYNCPVLYSDLPGLNVQMRDKSLLLDLRQPKSLAKNLLKVLDFDKDVETAVKKAYDSINNADRFSHWNKLKSILDNYEIVQKTWKA